MNKVKWGIIGCGDVTEAKSGPAFNKVANSTLVAVMRRDTEKAADYAHRHGIPKWYSNAKDLINDPDINAIYVATPPSTHALYAKMAIEAGKPVYMEKPMCRSYHECVKVNELAKQMDVPVFVAYYRRKLPGFEKVKSLINAGAIGKVQLAEIKLFKHFSTSEGGIPWRVVPEIAGGGHFYDLASHQIDFLNYLLGPVKAITSVVDNLAEEFEVEDSLSVSMQYKNGVIFNGLWSFGSGAVNNQDRFVIYGTKGRIEFSTFEFAPIKLINEDRVQEFDFPRPEHVQQNLIEEIVEAIINETDSCSTGETGAVTNLILEEIVESFYR